MNRTNSESTQWSPRFAPFVSRRPYQAPFSASKAYSINENYSLESKKLLCGLKNAHYFKGLSTR